MKNTVINQIKKAEKLVSTWKKVVAKEQKQQDKVDRLRDQLKELQQKVEDQENYLRALRDQERDTLLEAQGAIKEAQTANDEYHQDQPSEVKRDEFDKVVESVGADLTLDV